METGTVGLGSKLLHEIQPTLFGETRKIDDSGPRNIIYLNVIEQMRLKVDNLLSHRFLKILSEFAL